jgi:hypothetical protein
MALQLFCFTLVELFIMLFTVNRIIFYILIGLSTNTWFGDQKYSYPYMTSFIICCLWRCVFLVLFSCVTVMYGARRTKVFGYGHVTIRVFNHGHGHNGDGLWPWQWVTKILYGLWFLFNCTFVAKYVLYFVLVVMFMFGYSDTEISNNLVK